MNYRLRRGVVVTIHAKERLKKWIGCSERKFQKVAVKAHRSQEIVEARDICNGKFHDEYHGRTAFYRKHMGMVYVFTPDPLGRKYDILVTLYPPAWKQRSKTSRKIIPRPHFRGVKPQPKD